MIWEKKKKVIITINEKFYIYKKKVYVKKGVISIPKTIKEKAKKVFVKQYEQPTVEVISNYSLEDENTEEEENEKEEELIEYDDANPCLICFGWKGWVAYIIN